MRGKNIIIVSSQPKGRDGEGTLATGFTAKPGMILQEDPTLDLIGGRFQYKPYDQSADGERPAGSFWVLDFDYKIGHTVNTTYSAGDRLKLYCPAAGDELNLLLADVAGTADDHPAGQKLMVDDGTGKLVATTGTPETEVAMLLEAVTDPTADTLAWVRWTGY